MSRSRLFNWWLLFFAANTVFFALISTRYFSVASPFEGAAALLFGIIMTVGHAALLALIPLFPLLLLLLILPWKRVVQFSGILLCTFAAYVLLVDTYVFQLYRSHLDPAMIELLSGGAAGDIFVFSLATKIKAVIVLFAFTAFEAILSFLILKRVERSSSWRSAALSLSLIAVCALVQNGMYAWADAVSYLPVARQAGILPIYPRTTMRRFFERLGFELAKADDGLLKSANGGSLNYPLRALKCSKPVKLPNILFLIIDSWRFDTLSNEVTPSAFDLSKKSIVFKDHWSGGSATRSGIFSIFYGLPTLYWHQFLSERRGPVLISRLKELGYEFSIHGSAALVSPEFDQSAFVEVDNLRLRAEGATAADRDKDINREFKRFLQDRDVTRPFMGMLFYDAPHAFSVPPDAPKPFQPSLEAVDYMALGPGYDPKPFFNLYRNAVHFDDALSGEIVSDLKARGLFENTIIIMTGDHGQEFNENALNYWGHNGNFSRYQAAVPLVVYWPGKEASTIEHRTSHFDLAPTLMKEVLGCENDFSDYAVGRDLFGNQENGFLLLSNYKDYALVEVSKITMVKPLSGVEVLDNSLKPVAGAKPDPKLLKEAMEMQRRFLK